MKEIKTILMGYGNHAIVYPDVILTASPSMLMSEKTGSLFSEKIPDDIFQQGKEKILWYYNYKLKNNRTLFTLMKQKFSGCNDIIILFNESNKEIGIRYEQGFNRAELDCFLQDCDYIENNNCILINSDLKGE